MGGINNGLNTMLTNMGQTSRIVLGLAFITEGAIPYAASDPLRVLPACIAGTAVSTALLGLLKKNIES